MAAGEKQIKIKFTGDTKDLDRASRKAEKDIAGFGKRISQGIKNVTDKLPDMLSGVVGSLPPQAQAIALALTAGLSVALAGAIGAALSSAILLVAGGGVLALGIKAAIDDPKVTKAFDGLKKKASKIFEEFGKPFVDPLVRAAKTFSRLLDELKPDITALGRVIAPLIDQLAPALAGFFKAVMPGITAAVVASVPLFETLAEKLPIIGKAIGDFFAKIAGNGKQTNQFFGDLLNFVIGIIEVLGTLISKLTQLYGGIRNLITNATLYFTQFKVFLINMFGQVLDAAARAFAWVPNLGPKLATASQEFHKFQVKANNELQAIKDRNVKINVWSNVGSVARDVGNILAGIKGVNLPGRASGGPVSAGRSYLVGERGPEILTMGSSSGNITPNHQIGSGQPVIQVFIGNKELEQIAYQVVQQNNKDLKRRVGARAGA